MSAPLISLSQVHLAFGHHPLLDHADLSIQEGERIGLIGRNGAGKSSLLKLLSGAIHADDGERRVRSGLRIRTVEQEPEIDESGNIHEAVAGPLDLDAEDWSKPARVDALLEKLGLDGNAAATGLSGGTRKRIALARALADEPDLLLLDEPTNHLDFDGINWLEEALRQATCAVVIITHDRRFLDAVATRIVELDRGQLLGFPGNFSQWQQHKAQWLESQRLEEARFDKLLAQEEVWIRKGVEARRTRNEGRVRRLEQLRVERAQRRDLQGKVNLQLDQGERSGKLVAELESVSKTFGDRTVIRDYSTAIMRGDRIGIIGPNGAGKTTLLKIMLGELAPDSGTVRLGSKLQVAYFDQMRAQLDENATLADVISPGSEWVEIGNERKHIMSYLGDFLFAPARAGSPVSSLSGGERARLLLARLFARLPISWYWTNPPTTWTSKRWNCWKACCRNTAAQYCWSATTAHSWITLSPRPSPAKAMASGGITSAATKTGWPSGPPPPRQAPPARPPPAKKRLRAKKPLPSRKASKPSAAGSNGNWMRCRARSANWKTSRNP
ncbi:ATP-binding cassette subfamily F protein uup [Kerstersia gyiorum]|nr:ATP-binding cassette subfamily F protein uup [Kerstersia gyiorum]MCP1824230.1 ATP-binding cassette subfamily F protein uup [Kerstersia gyiorum]MCP1827820.1 ATP-binding cassette subfamily F protein uup [Kerstersia gyiorum]MCW2451304.1 ATP-binding cassette subfamily F protein uup [Kerstersia gyiorum]